MVFIVSRITAMQHGVGIVFSRTDCTGALAPSNGRAARTTAMVKHISRPAGHVGREAV